MATQSDEPDAKGSNGQADTSAATAAAQVAESASTVTTSPVNDADRITPQRSQTATSDRTGLVEVFKANLIQAGLYQPATDKVRASHDDVTLMCVRPPLPL